MSYRSLIIYLRGSGVDGIFATSATEVKISVVNEISAVILQVQLSHPLATWEAVSGSEQVQLDSGEVQVSLASRSGSSAVM